jgi:translation initiation factor 1
MATKLVWTSDPEEARRVREERQSEVVSDADPSKQTIRVTLDRKRRAGKTVTVASGFRHTPELLARLAAALKKKCGSGGTARGDEIEIQGDHLNAVSRELETRGYRVAPTGRK